jgi:hypothetical protein
MWLLYSTLHYAEGPSIPFTKKLSGGTRSAMPFSCSFLVITLAAESVIQRGIRKQVSKQATARLRSSSDETSSRKERRSGLVSIPVSDTPR